MSDVEKPRENEINQAKADFHDIYTAPTPHAYLSEMASLGYQIGEQAKPYLNAACSFLQKRNGPESTVGMLDLGCSYGVASALVKYGCSLEELLSFFDGRAPSGREECVRATERWLHAVEPSLDIDVVGLDASAPAIRFGESSGLLDDGISENLEETTHAPTDDSAAKIRRSNLLVSTGAIGYVTERTFAKLLPELGRDHEGPAGPIAVLTVLRMFDMEPIARCFEEADMQIEPLPGVLLPQRAFASEKEKNDILSFLRDRNVDTAGAEDEGVLFAELWFAARKSESAGLRQALGAVANQDTPDPLLTTHVEVALSANA